MSKFYRLPKTTNELRKQADDGGASESGLRIKGRSRKLVTAYDDLPPSRSRSWKSSRKTRWH